jgi:DNA-binding response OmpR family regulator
MILIVSSSSRETALLTALCDHRTWASHCCPTVREFALAMERVRPRAVVVRQRLLDGYSDDILSCLQHESVANRPRIIVLMAAGSPAHAEARQLALGADCVLHDPVKMEIFLEYLAKYRNPLEAPIGQPTGHATSFHVAGIEVIPQEHRILRDKKSLHVAPQEVALLRLLARSPNEVVPYPVLYGDLFNRRFGGDTANCRVLLGKVAASFKRLGVDLRASIQVIPKSGYLYVPPSGTPGSPAAKPKARSSGKKLRMRRPRRAGYR